MSGGKILDKICVELRHTDTGDILPVTIDVFDHSLGHKWLAALNHLLANDYHLEKNYCFLGFATHRRDGAYILDQVNRSIQAINQSGLGYHIDDHFTMENTMTDEVVDDRRMGRNIIQDRLNRLHRCFEDLQGNSTDLSGYFKRATAEIRWHIRQLNLLCHEFESWALSYRKQIEAPDWQRPSQLMCWLNAPRFELDDKDHELFGIHTINRGLGSVFVGVNKSVGKHHWEVFNDEGRDSRLNELTTSALITQTQASGDFDIEWGQDPGAKPWQQQRLKHFREWLIINGFDPDDRGLTIGHPQIGQVDLEHSFGTQNFQQIWSVLDTYLDVYSVSTSDQRSVYDYRWNDLDFVSRQISIIERNQ